MKPELVKINLDYFHRILNWKNIEYEFVGNLVKVNGFNAYNKLIDINSVFSSYPYGDIVDRTNSIKSPFKFKTLRDHRPASSILSLDELIERRVRTIVASGRKINICWSGGIDSTCALVGFLKHAPDLSQLRVLYSPFSLYENRDFFNMLTSRYGNIETLDISGAVFMNTHFDGVFVNGHGGDEFTASLDDSFHAAMGGDKLYASWKDHFYDKNHDSKFIEFCETYFSNKTRPIETVLDARWYFYALNKSQVFQVADASFLNNQQHVSLNDMIGFFDSDDFEGYMFLNPQLIIEDRHDYKTYKKFMKRYIFDFDKNAEYYQNKCKENSSQFMWYTRKKICMLDSRYIAKLSDNSVISTPNLPFFSKKEFDSLYGNSLDYLFNEAEA